MRTVKGTIATEPYVSSGTICFSLHLDENGDMMSCMSAVDYVGSLPTIGRKVFLIGEHKADFTLGTSPIFSFSRLEAAESQKH